MQKNILHLGLMCILLISWIDYANAVSCQACCGAPETACSEAKCTGCDATVGGKGCYFHLGTTALTKLCSDCSSVTKCEDYVSNNQGDACKANECKVNLPDGCKPQGFTSVNCISASITTTTTTTTTTTISGGGGGGGSGEGSSEVINKIKTAVYTIVMHLYCLVVYISAALAALFVIITGIKYMSSDEEGGRAEARRRMVYSLAGLMVIALACPLVNLLFSNTNIGIPDASGNKVPCRGCPYINEMSSGGGGDLGGWGGGFSGGDTSDRSWWSDPARKKQAESFQECSESQPCPTGKVCADTATGTYRCYPKIADGHKVGDSDLQPLPGHDKRELCMSGMLDHDDDTCMENPGCPNNADCDTDEYCGTDGFCHPDLGETASCGTNLMKSSSDDADDMCQSKWCTSHGCRPKDKCWVMEDCTSHDDGTYCNDNQAICFKKADVDDECHASWVLGGNADLMCESGHCDTTKDKCI